MNIIEAKSLPCGLPISTILGKIIPPSRVKAVPEFQVTQLKDSDVAWVRIRGTVIKFHRLFVVPPIVNLSAVLFQL
jgi:hypothetical protein